MAFLEEMLYAAPVAEANRYRIVHAMIELSKTQRYDEMYVKDICDTTGIARQTFYRHFNSKHDVCFWFWDQFGKRYTRNVGVLYNWYDSYLHAFQAAEPYMDFFSLMSGFESLDSPARRAQQLRQETLTSVLTDRVGVTMTPKLMLEVKLFSESESVLDIGEFARAGVTRPEDIADVYTALVPQNLRRLIDDYMLTANSQESPTS